MDVSDELLSVHMEGLTLREALERKKLFQVDLRLLAGIFTVPGSVVSHLLNSSHEELY